MPDDRMPSDEEVAAERAEKAAPDETPESEVPSPARGSRRTRLIVAGVAAGALVAGGLAIGIPLLTAPSPQAIVDDYAAAIESGDAAAAAALWTPDASDVELALLAEAEPSQTPTFSCEPVVVDGDAATAECMLELVVEPTAMGGPVTLDLARDGGRWALALESAAAMVVDHVEQCVATGDILRDCDMPIPDGATAFEATPLPMQEGSWQGGRSFLLSFEVGEPGSASFAVVTGAISVLESGDGFAFDVESVEPA